MSMEALEVSNSAVRRSGTLNEVWAHRELLRHLVVRNLKVKYKKSVLGFIWTLVNPLLTVAVLVAVFGYVVRLEIPHYWAFLVSGYFVWNFLSMVMGASTRVLSEYAALSRSVRVPEHVFVLSVIGARLFEFTIEITIFLAGMALFHHGAIPIGYAFLPLLILCQVLLATGLALPIATMAAFFDDVQHALPVLLLILFYLSPVFYPLSLVPEDVRSVYLLNPIARLISGFHRALYEGTAVPLNELLILGSVSLLCCFAGFAVFNRKRFLFAEIL